MLGAPHPDQRPKCNLTNNVLKAYHLHDVEGKLLAVSALNIIGQ